MQKRSVRMTVLALLLATPPAAAYVLWHIDRTSSELVAAEDAMAARLQGMSDAVAAIGTAQQSYVAPGQLDEPWFERVSALVQQLTDDATATAPRLRSAVAAATLERFDDSTDMLTAADRRTRENLSLGQELMAADVIFGDGRNLLDGMIGQLRDIQRAERAWYRGRAAALTRERWVVLGLVALLWVGGVGFVTHVGRVLSAFAKATADRRSFSGGWSDPPGSRVPKDPAYRSQGTVERSVEPATTDPPSIDLPTAAALCTDLSRVTDSTALSKLLHRAAALLDASGVMLWLGAGEQLFAVLVHGYSPDTVARFGPLTRQSDSAVAAAWRTGRLMVVSGDAKTHGALVAPMFGPERCIGVLALEIREGREQDPAIQSVAAIIAAQLATAVSAWPAASSA